MLLARCKCSNTYPGDLIVCPSCGAPTSTAMPAPVDPRDRVYDIETYPNIFTYLDLHLSTGTEYLFEISDRVNQIDALVSHLHWLGSSGARQVGYNNIGFDYPVLHYILRNPHVSVREIYAHAMSIIRSNNRWENQVWPSDWVVEQIDLFKMWHFDNAAKSTSLKALEFTMRMDSIEDLPFPVGTELTDPQKDTLIEYNRHDVEATARFYARSLTPLQLREALSKKFGRSFINMSNTKMGETILVMEMEKRGIQCYSWETGRKEKRQTHRDSINLGECIFQYIHFERPEFEAIRKTLAARTITQTKGVFTEIDVDWDVAQYMQRDTLIVTGPSVSKPKGVKLSTLPDDFDPAGHSFRICKDASLNCVVDGVTYFFGTGGLHGSLDNRIIRSDDTMQIVDVDVESYYPNMAIKNGLYAEHLGVAYCDAYEGIFLERKKYPKSAPENGAYKEALNASFGNSNNDYSPLKDPKYTMTTTIGGQLSLCMLIEHMVKIPGLQMIQANTDGITFACPRAHMDHMRAVCKWWESVTQLTLEEALYESFFVRDVNSYMAVKADGKVKRIGAYAYERADENPGTREKPYWKNTSYLVVAKAAEAALVRGEDIETFIRNHPDDFDFMIRGKAQRGARLVMEWPEHGPDAQMELQKTIRYYISTDGGDLIGLYKPTGEPGAFKKRTGVSDAEYAKYDPFVWNEAVHTKNKSTYQIVKRNLHSGYRVTDCSNVTNFSRSNLNYDWYIAEARKLVDALVN